LLEQVVEALTLFPANGVVRVPASQHGAPVPSISDGLSVSCCELLWVETAGRPWPTCGPLCTSG
jgi:hypothetical protein